MGKAANSKRRVSGMLNGRLIYSTNNWNKVDLKSEPAQFIPNNFVLQISTGAREAFHGFLMQEPKDAPRENSVNSYGNGNHLAEPAYIPRVNIDDIVSGSKRVDPEMILQKLGDT